MRIPLAAVLVIGIAANAAAQEPVPIVLKLVGSANAIETDGKGRVTVTLASGTRITIPFTDIDPDRSQAVLAADNAKAAESRPTPAPNELMLNMGAATAVVQKKCQAEWKDDFTMRAFCEQNQKKALEALRGRAMASGDRLNIRNRCSKEWSDDFMMMNFCEEQQLKALATLQR